MHTIRVEKVIKNGPNFDSEHFPVSAKQPIPDKYTDNSSSVHAGETTIIGRNNRLLDEPVSKTTDSTTDDNTNNIAADGFKSKDADGSVVTDDYTTYGDGDKDNDPNDDVYSMGNNRMSDPTEQFKQTTRTKTTDYSTKLGVEVIMSAKSIANLYHNNNPIGSATDSGRAYKFEFEAYSHDVIAISSSGSRKYHGVIALINIENKVYVTGEYGFKAIEENLATYRARDSNFWRTTAFKSCSWNRPVNVRRQKGRGTVRDFPNTEAKYVWANVWANNERNDEMIFLRFVIHGEECNENTPKQTYTPSPNPEHTYTPSPMTSPKHTYTQIPSTSPKYTPHPSHSAIPVGGDKCECRLVKTDSIGDCFDFNNVRMYTTYSQKALCMRRDCDAKFECVDAGEKGESICVRRFATSEVRPVGPVFNQYCINVKLPYAKPFYILHH